MVTAILISLNKYYTPILPKGISILTKGTNGDYYFTTEDTEINKNLSALCGEYKKPKLCPCWVYIIRIAEKYALRLTKDFS